MRQRARNVIGDERAAAAAFFPIGTEHEVVDDELGLVAEEIGERDFA